jgi:hypothetical protein
MTNLTLQLQQLLSKYESTFNYFYQNAIPQKVFPGIPQLIADFNSITITSSADDFFGIYGVGNSTTIAHFPFERQVAYELLLQILQLLNPIQYKNIHKGTPYYFIGWTAYQYGEYAKAIFYMDAAVSEDLKIANVQNRTSTRPALEFFLLRTQGNPTGLTTHLELLNVVENTINEFNSNSGLNITIGLFRSNFIEDLLYSGAEGRSLLTALYTFLLDHVETEKEITLRSDTGGSIQPFIDHLFDGARILESLLERRGGAGNTLRPKITNTPLISVSPNVLLGGQRLTDAENQYTTLKAAGNSFQDCNFSSAFIIRNTSGHSLLWPDQFTSGNSYKTLYHNLVNSIFWTIEKLWL